MGKFRKGQWENPSSSEWRLYEKCKCSRICVVLKWWVKTLSNNGILWNRGYLVGWLSIRELGGNSHLFQTCFETTLISYFIDIRFYTKNSSLWVTKLTASLIMAAIKTVPKQQYKETSPVWASQLRQTSRAEKMDSIKQHGHNKCAFRLSRPERGPLSQKQGAARGTTGSGERRQTWENKTTYYPLTDWVTEQYNGGAPHMSDAVKDCMRNQSLNFIACHLRRSRTHDRNQSSGGGGAHTVMDVLHTLLPDMTG